MKKAKKIEPNLDEVYTDRDGGKHAMIMDEEGDEITLDFNNDDCVMINTEDYAHIALSRQNIEMMLSLLDDAEMEYAVENLALEEKEVK